MFVVDAYVARWVGCQMIIAMIFASALPFGKKARKRNRMPRLTSSTAVAVAPVQRKHAQSYARVSVHLRIARNDDHTRRRRRRRSRLSFSWRVVHAAVCLFVLLLFDSERTNNVFFLRRRMFLGWDVYVIYALGHVCLRVELYLSIFIAFTLRVLYTYYIQYQHWTCRCIYETV